MKGGKIVARKRKGISVFAGTFLGEILDALEAKNFEALEELSPIEEGEEVVGEMTDLEKTILILFKTKVKTGREICKGCGDTPEDQKSAKCAEQKRLISQAKILKRVFWQIVEDRLSLPGDDSLGIRQDGKIVKLEDKDPLSGLQLPGGEIKIIHLGRF